MFNLITKKRGNFKDDTLSGLTVALALVPEAIAFSFAAGVPPLVGLWAAVFMGFITSAFGGRPGMISGATGAIAVVVAKAFKYGELQGDGMGLEYVFAAVMIAGVIQLLFGLFKLGHFIRLVPHPVMIGFVNGLAIVILMAQFQSFQFVNGEWLPQDKLLIMFGLVLLTMLIIQFFPKLTKAVPSTLVAIIAVGLLSYYGTGSRTVADVLFENTGSKLLQGNFPLPQLPMNILWEMENIKVLLSVGFTVAMVGIIESLMTLQLVDDLTETRGKSDRESIAQGAANFLSGLFGGMGGCAMIGQSLINIKSGGRGRTSGIVAAISLALFIMVGGYVIGQIPIAALTGVMFMVVIGTLRHLSPECAKLLENAGRLVEVEVAEDDPHYTIARV
jgi:SulP family sulfate permease